MKKQTRILLATLALVLMTFTACDGIGTEKATIVDFRVTIPMGGTFGSFDSSNNSLYAVAQLTDGTEIEVKIPDEVRTSDEAKKGKIGSIIYVQKNDDRYTFVKFE